MEYLQSGNFDKEKLKVMVVVMIVVAVAVGQLLTCALYTTCSLVVIPSTNMFHASNSGTVGLLNKVVIFAVAVIRLSSWLFYHRCYNHLFAFCSCHISKAICTSTV